MPSDYLLDEYSCINWYTKAMKSCVKIAQLKNNSLGIFVKC